jgi:hypothetical protein
MIRTAFHRSERAHALFDVHPLLLGGEALKEEEECVICMNEYGESDLTMEYVLSYSLQASLSTMAHSRYAAEGLCST